MLIWLCPSSLPVCGIRGSVWAYFGSVWALLEVTALASGNWAWLHKRTLFLCLETCSEIEIWPGRKPPQKPEYLTVGCLKTRAGTQSRDSLWMLSPNQFCLLLHQASSSCSCTLDLILCSLLGDFWWHDSRRLRERAEWRINLSCMWILGTPIKSKKETEKEDVASCWNVLWATSCLWLGQNLHNLFPSFFLFSFFVFLFCVPVYVLVP